MTVLASRRRIGQSGSFAIGLALCMGLVSGTSRATAGESVQDLAYGVTLYHFYQQQYFNALTELTAAQQLERLPNHGEGAQLLRGGMSLSYGMDETAKSIFEELLAQPREGVDRDQAWFYLGKLAWQRTGASQIASSSPESDSSEAGPFAESAAALARMAVDYTGPVADEAHYLKATQSLAIGDESQAEVHLQALQQSCPWRSYYAYNLGASRAATGSWEQAGNVYRQLALSECDSAEGKALQDKAMVAAGFASLAAGDAVQAGADFQRVRVDGPESDKALLGYGWSFANQSEFLKALSPWQRLAQRPLLSVSARESLLAVPWAYERLERPALALGHYQTAAQRLAEQLEQLAKVTGELQAGEMADLFGLQTGESDEWLGGSDLGPQGEYAAELGYFLSTDSVQISLRELRDLYSVAQRLKHANERLNVLTQVASEQDANWSSVISGGRAQALQLRRDELAAAVASLRNTLNTAAQRSDGRALAVNEQAQRWRRLERAEGLSNSLGNDNAQVKLRVMRGLLHWNDSENYPDRVWQLQRDMQALEAQLAESDKGLMAVAAAIANRQFTVSAQRIVKLQTRLAKQQRIVDETLQRADQQMRKQVMAELGRQREQLVYGLGQSRLAIARLYDRASLEVPR